MKLWAALAAAALAANQAAGVVGVGLSVRIAGDYPVVDTLIAAGPAARGGQLKPGDRIEAIAQGLKGKWIDTTGMTLEEFVGQVRGKAGTKIRLRAARGPRGQAPKIVLVTLTREALKESP